MAACLSPSACQDQRAAVSLGGHLFFHRDANVFRRVDVLYVDARNFYAPLVGSLVEDQAQLGVDLVARRERMVEIHLAHHRTHAGDRQLHETPDQIVDLINGFDRVGDLPIDDRIDGDRHVIPRDYGLRGKIDKLLAEVDRRSFRGAHWSNRRRAATRKTGR